MSLFLVVLVEWCTLHHVIGNDFRNLHGRRISIDNTNSCTATCQIGRGDVAIVAICMVAFRSTALFSLHARGSSL